MAEKEHFRRWLVANERLHGPDPHNKINELGPRPKEDSELILEYLCMVVIHGQKHQVDRVKAFLPGMGKNRRDYVELRAATGLCLIDYRLNSKLDSFQHNQCFPALRKVWFGKDPDSWTQDLDLVFAYCKFWGHVKTKDADSMMNMAKSAEDDPETTGKGSGQPTRDAVRRLMISIIKEHDEIRADKYERRSDEVDMVQKAAVKRLLATLGPAIKGWDFK